MFHPISSKWLTSMIHLQLHIVFWAMIPQEVISNFLEWLKGKILFSLKMCDKGFIKYNFSNLGTYEDTFLNFSLTQGRELFCKICKCRESKAFTYYLNKPGLICKAGKKNYITFHKWLLYDVVFSLLSFISDWPILECIVFSSYSGMA